MPEKYPWRHSSVIKDGLNRHYNNAKIEWHELPEKEMRRLGFTDHRPDYWYKFWTVGEQTTLNITIPKPHVNDDLEIAVLDEMFCQPYDYQHILSKNPSQKFARNVRDRVEALIDQLQEDGIIRGHVRGDYI